MVDNMLVVSATQKIHVTNGARAEYLQNLLDEYKLCAHLAHTPFGYQVTCTARQWQQAMKRVHHWQLKEIEAGDRLQRALKGTP